MSVLHWWRQRRSRAAAPPAEAVDSSSGLDPLTGLRDRRDFLSTFERQVGDGLAGAVLFMDLDHFKLINDRFGHTEGDVVLRTVAARLEAARPSAGDVFRLSGDEFVVLVTGVDLQEATALARRLAAAIAEPMLVAGALRVLTVTTGVARNGRNADNALRVADTCLYAAKTRARGSVVTQDDLGEVRKGRYDLVQQIHQLQDERDALMMRAITDELTGLRNRRAFDAGLLALHAQAEREDLPYAVLYMDLDRFHDLNRARGDGAGDDALRVCASALVAECRTAADVVYRKGGEELVALLPLTTLEEAVAVGERMRLAVLAAAIPYEDEPGSDVVTISGGIAAFDPALPRSADDVVGAANRAMVAAKEQGRNRFLTD